jgi:hypothetical protein
MCVGDARVDDGDSDRVTARGEIPGTGRLDCGHSPEAGKEGIVGRCGDPEDVVGLRVPDFGPPLEGSLGGCDGRAGLDSDADEAAQRQALDDSRSLVGKDVGARRGSSRA